MLFICPASPGPSLQFQGYFWSLTTTPQNANKCVSNIKKSQMLNNEKTAQMYSIVGNRSVKATENPNELKGAKDANEIEALK